MQIDESSLQTFTSDVLAVSAGRAGAFTAGIAALTGIVVGSLALFGSHRSSGAAARVSGASGATVLGMALGLVGLVIGGIVAATSDGSLGTGNGFGGAVVAMVLGLVALVVGGVARARRARVAT